MKLIKTDEIQTVRELIESFESDKLHLTAFKSKKNGFYQSINYGRLQDAVKALAQGLRKTGIKKGDKIALLAENRIKWALSYLAVTYLGAVIVPLDIFLNSEEILPILKTVKAKALFCSEKYLPKITPLKKQLPALKHIIRLDPGKEIYQEKKEADFQKRMEGVEKEEFKKKQPFKEYRHLYFLNFWFKTFAFRRINQ